MATRVYLIEIPDSVAMTDEKIIKQLKEAVEKMCDITLTDEQVIRADD